MMNTLFNMAWKIVSLFDHKGFLFDKSIKWYTFIQKNQSFSASCHWLGAVIELV